MMIPTVPEPELKGANRISWMKSEEALRTLEAIPLSFGAVIRRQSLAQPIMHSRTLRSRSKSSSLPTWPEEIGKSST